MQTRLGTTGSDVQWSFCYTKLLDYLACAYLGLKATVSNKLSLCFPSLSGGGGVAGGTLISSRRGIYGLGKELGIPGYIAHSCNMRFDCVL